MKAYYVFLDGKEKMVVMGWSVKDAVYFAMKEFFKPFKWWKSCEIYNKEKQLLASKKKRKPWVIYEGKRNDQYDRKRFCSKRRSCKFSNETISELVWN